MGSIEAKLQTFLDKINQTSLLEGNFVQVLCCVVMKNYQLQSEMKCYTYICGDDIKWYKSISS